MLPITSTSSPSTAAALEAKLRCSGVPRRARWNTSAPSAAATPTSAPAMVGFTEPMKMIEQTTATHGGSTFQEPVFSVVNAALDVAVMRLASAPGSRSAK